MLLNYLKTAFRNYRKNKLYASLNIIGLAIGYAAVILIAIYVHFETSYENFHSKADRIFRPTYHFNNGAGFDVHWARVHHDYINQLPDEFPEVEQLIRFQNHQRTYVRVDQQKFRPQHAYVTDSTVFEVFDFHLISGDPATALAHPHSIVLTESLAKKYFGEVDAMGKEIFITGDYTTEEVSHKVTGVMADLPANTHLPVDMLRSYAKPEDRSWWAYVYVLLNEEASIEDVEAKMSDFMAKHTDENAAVQGHFQFQPLQDIHLQSNLAREIVPNGNALYVKVFLFVGLFILAIAMINYLNLSSALSVGRSREVGMRMILGAEKGQLVRFALLESVIYNLLAGGLGLLIAMAALPYFRELAEVEMLLDPVVLLGGIALIAIICGLLAGIYPAFIMTAFSSLKMIRHSKSFNLAKSGSSGAYLFKRILVGLQFCASILLIASAWIAQNQIKFLHEKNLGMEKEQVLAIPGVPNPVTDQYPAFRDRVSNIPGVSSVAACMEVPSREIRDAGPTLVLGGNQDKSQAPMLDVQVISPGFLETMGIELLAGEDRTDKYVFGPNPQFSEDYTPVDYLNGEPRTYMINETAMKLLGWESPEEAIGQQVSWSIGGFDLKTGPITGVVKDFHQESLKNKVDPLILLCEKIWLRTFLLKMETANIERTIAEVQSAWDQLFATYPIEYHFLDELYDQLYKNEGRQMKLLTILSGLAIFIAFLGLFSLVAYSLQTRVKELAVRRVLGAQLSDLIRLIGREYLYVLLIGGVIAIPLSYLWVSEWLQNFAYSVEISPFVYGLTLFIIAGMLLATVSFQTLRSTNTDLVEVLRED